MRACGCSASAVNKMFKVPTSNNGAFPNPSGKHFTSLSHDIHTRQLYPGEKLDIIGNGFVDHFKNSLVLERLVSEYPYAKQNYSGSTATSLLRMCSEILIDAAQNVYFGPLLSQIDPGLVRTFIDFDDRSWQLLFQVPYLLSTEMHALKDNVVNAFVAYFNIPSHERQGGAWSIEVLEGEMRQLGLTNREIATMIMILYWGSAYPQTHTLYQAKTLANPHPHRINTNTPKGAFWMLAYILHNPTLIPLIRTEIAPAFNSNTIDLHYLTSSCPQLKSIWLETLRLSSASASVRFITQDTFIDGKLLRRGNRLMIPYRQLHFNESVFGDDVNSFDPMRFANKEHLTRSASWRPFGGGQTLCPGRFVAQQTILSFVAMILHNFDFDLAFPQEFPRADEGRPVLGIMGSLDDVAIRISRREKK